MTGGIRTNTDLKEIANMFGAERQLQRESNLHNCRWYTIIYLVLQEPLSRATDWEIFSIANPWSIPKCVNVSQFTFISSFTF